MSILACAGSDEPGANYTPPTLGEFMRKQDVESKRLREARAGAQVVSASRLFHERQAHKFGINTNRGLAHFRASKMFTQEGGRLQEMFDQGGQAGELPPKAVMKANKAAMHFHKKQADKAGLDSDLGHAHVAAMEHHQDAYQKAKQQCQAQKQQQPGMESAEGGPGSGRHKGEGGGAKSFQDRHEKLKSTLKSMAKNFPQHHGLGEAGSHLRKAADAMKKGDWDSAVDHHDDAEAALKSAGHREALPGHGSKQSPVPVPKKSEQPSEDIQDPNKPPVQLSPEDANDQPRRLQQNESRRRAINNFGRESNAQSRVEMGLGHGYPKGAGTQVDPDLVYRGPRTKEARRRRHL